MAFPRARGAIRFYDSTQAARATTDFKWPSDTQHALGSQYLEVGTEVVRVGLPKEVDQEVEVAGHITPNIRFPELDLLFHHGVSAVMDTVVSIMNDIEVRI